MGGRIPALVVVVVVGGLVVVVVVGGVIRAPVVAQQNGFGRGQSTCTYLHLAAEGRWAEPSLKDVMRWRG